MADNLSPSVESLCNLAKDKIESVCSSLTNSVGTCDAEEALNDIDLIVSAVTCLDSVIRVPDDVYQDISIARRMIENSSQASMRTPRVKTSMIRSQISSTTPRPSNSKSLCSSTYVQKCT